MMAAEDFSQKEIEQLWLAVEATTGKPRADLLSRTLMVLALIPYTWLNAKKISTVAGIQISAVYDIFRKMIDKEILLEGPEGSQYMDCRLMVEWLGDESSEQEKELAMLLDAMVIRGELRPFKKDGRIAYISALLPLAEEEKPPEVVEPRIAGASFEPA